MRNILLFLLSFTLVFSLALIPEVYGSTYGNPYQASEGSTCYLYNLELGDVDLTVNSYTTYSGFQFSSSTYVSGAGRANGWGQANGANSGYYPWTATIYKFVDGSWKVYQESTVNVPPVRENWTAWNEAVGASADPANFPNGCENPCIEGTAYGTMQFSGKWVEGPYCIQGCEAVGDGEIVGTVYDDTDGWLTIVSGVTGTGETCTIPEPGEDGEEQPHPGCDEILAMCTEMCGGEMSGYQCTAETWTCGCDNEVPPLIDPGDGGGMTPDTDKDGTPNSDDGDADNDGATNKNDDDVDGDGNGNGATDPDTDGDGISNGGEDGGSSGWEFDGPTNDPDGYGADPDVDGDGLGNGTDGDVDGDGYGNGNDGDVDGDGISNKNDGDADGDGIGNATDGTPYGIGGGDGSATTGTAGVTDGGNGDGYGDGDGDGDGEGEEEEEEDEETTLESPDETSCPDGQVCPGDGVCQSGEDPESTDCSEDTFIQDRFNELKENLSATDLFSLTDSLTSFDSSGSSTISVDLGSYGEGSFDYADLDTIWGILNAVFSVAFGFLGIRIVTLKR
jgi:hypothetical protein